MSEPKMFLTGDEVRELTKRVHFKSQSKVLRSLGVEHRTRPDGSIAVLRSHAEEVFSGGKVKRKKEAAEPNWSALHAARA